jgi:hypothetical protein
MGEWLGVIGQINLLTSLAFGASVTWFGYFIEVTVRPSALMLAHNRSVSFTLIVSSS